ncbi:MAG: nitroreductase [Oscillospiraceae bacterium]|nr:nitroreductase [Oscillospiraceae bacterium]
MNTVYEAILSRRSIKSYTAQQVPQELLEKVIEAGRYAPTGMNAMAPIFIAVQNPEVIAKLSKMNAAVMGMNGDPFYGAPTVILVLANRERGTWLQDGSLAMENLQLAAHALGLGSCWIHRCYEMFESDEGKALLKEWGVEGDYAGVACCILGYAAGEPKPRIERRENQVFYVK